MIDLNETETEFVHDIGNKFYKDFSKLIAEVLMDMDPTLHDNVLEKLQEKASVYGSNYEKYLNGTEAKVLGGSETALWKITVFECVECGFNIALDAVYLDQVDGIEMPCPNMECGAMISTEKAITEKKDE